MNATKSKQLADKFHESHTDKSFSEREYNEVISKINSCIDTAVKFGKYDTTVQIYLSNTALLHRRLDDIKLYLKKNKYTVNVVYLDKSNQFFNISIHW